jgi:hypothetical protein
MDYWEVKMIKTTNYEISKKLAEIGFKAEAEFFFYLDKPDYGAWHISEGIKGQILANKKDDCLPSYDLETLLDALPHNFMLEKKIKFLNMNQSEIGYKTGSSDIYDYQLLCHRRKEESLADTAGRLIILFHEENLIKFLI